jgi:hypothetical protein
MPDQLKNLLLITIVVFLLIFLWAVSIAVTYWDAVTRRKLPGIEAAAWIGLVVLVPGVGFAAYLFTRLLGRGLSPSQPGFAKPRRVTSLKRQPEAEPRTGTIPAAEFLQPYTTQTLAAPKLSEVARIAPRYKMIIIAGANTGDEFSLVNFPVKIGRGLDVSIRLDEDQLVSRLHAEIYVQSGVLRIRDLNSSHGTKVNNFSITDKSLDPGDQVQVGITILKVEVQEEPA